MAEILFCGRSMNLYANKPTTPPSDFELEKLKRLKGICKETNTSRDCPGTCDIEKFLKEYQQETGDA